MKYSAAELDGTSRLDLLAVVVLDLTARLAVPMSLLTLAHGAALVASTAAVAVAACGMLRGILQGRLSEHITIQLWRRIVVATGGYDILSLRKRSLAKQSSLLIEGPFHAVTLATKLRPRLVSDLVGLGVVAAATMWRLGSDWLLIGAIASSGLGLMVVFTRKRFKHIEGASYALSLEVASDVLAMMEAPAELRAHGAQAALSERVVERAAKMARSQRRAETLSALMGLVPLGVALLAASAPVWRGTVEQLLPLRFAEVGVLGATGLVFVFGLVRTIESIVRSGPRLHALDTYLSEADATAAHRTDEVQSWSGDLEVSGVSFVYPGAEIATPSAMSCRWPDGRGLALTGPNGAGKSTFVMLLLGLLKPTEGTLRLAGQPLTPTRLAGLRRGVAYIPQRPFVAETRSVAWHLRFGQPCDPTECEAALRKTGVWSLLERHRPDDPLAVTLAELSGGERQRVHVARAFVGTQHGPLGLVIFDEPEAGLDPEARKTLKSLISELAETTRVLLVAHDDRVVPADFQVVGCHADSRGACGAMPDSSC